jgi:hypothetical protein
MCIVAHVLQLPTYLCFDGLILFSCILRCSLCRFSDQYFFLGYVQLCCRIV